MNEFRNIYSCLGNHGWNIMILLHSSDMSYSQLLKNLRIHTGTIAATLRCLKANGIVYQKRSSINFQILAWSLTPKGQKLLDTTRNGLMEVELECQE